MKFSIVLYEDDYFSAYDLGEAIEKQLREKKLLDEGRIKEDFIIVIEAVERVKI